MLRSFRVSFVVAIAFSFGGLFLTPQSAQAQSRENVRTKIAAAKNAVMSTGMARSQVQCSYDTMIFLYNLRPSHTAAEIAVKNHIDQQMVDAAGLHDGASEDIAVAEEFFAETLYAAADFYAQVAINCCEEANRTYTQAQNDINLLLILTYVPTMP